MIGKIIAEFNHGRWVAVCPACLEQGMQVASAVESGDVFICPNDYPNILAITLMPNPRVPGAFNPIPDEPLRMETHQAALSAGDWYEVIFPEAKAEIERVLRVRPVHARNWIAGVELSELQNENKRMMKND